MTAEDSGPRTGAAAQISDFKHDPHFPVHFRFVLTMENLPDDETMEILTKDELNEWKVALALNQPETTEDKELQRAEDGKEQDDRENEETLNNKNATEYYTELTSKAKDLQNDFRDDSDIEKVIGKLQSLVFPYIENATLRAETALEALRTALANASGVSETTDVVLSDEYIDAQMNPSERLLLNMVDSTTRRSVISVIRSGIRSRLEELNTSRAETQNSRLETQKSRVENELNLLVGLAERVQVKTKDIDSVLGEMATLTQAENSVGRTSLMAERSARQRKLQRRADFQHRDEDDKVFPKETQGAIDNLFHGAVTVSSNSPFHKTNLEEVWNLLDETTKKRIQAIHNIYNAFIRTSEILDRPGCTKTGEAEETASNKRRKASSDNQNEAATTLNETAAGKETRTRTIAEDDYKRKIAESTKILTELFQHDVQSNSHPTHDGKPHFFPGPRGQEVGGAQPFFGCLLDAIGLVAEKWHVQKWSTKRTASVESPEQEKSPLKNGLEKESAESPDPNGRGEAAHKQEKSPPKSGWGKESAVQGRDGSFRYGDFVIKRSGCHIWVYRPDTLPVVIEIKAFYRNDKAWDELMINAVQQVLNHTSRYVRVGLNFAGAGVKSHATGAIGSLAYIQVYRLELEKPGTEETCLKIVKSELLPLMDKSTFEIWMRANQRVAEDVDLGGALDHLFSEEGRLFSKEDEVPFGLLAMYQLMMSSKSELFG
jgi:hypothetical protein